MRQVYNTIDWLSNPLARLVCSCVEACDSQGYISRVPHFNPVLRVFESPETAEILTALVARSAAPLAALESNFAVDSTGFSGCRYDQWYAHRYKNVAPIIKRVWVKAHAAIGTVTNVVTAVKVMQNDSHDINHLLPLMDETAKSFPTINDVCADKAYLSDWMLKELEHRGVGAMIPFRANSVAGRSATWDRAFHYFHLHRDEFMARYHRRSNVESTFSMIKRKYGDSVKAKTDQCMIGEVLAKFVCHNLSCLIHAIEEFGIDPTFGCTRSDLSAPKLAVI